MTNASNSYCAALGIPVPRVEDARSSPDANCYGLLLVALLERGAPLTLEEAALRFEEAGVAPASEALASLKRCKPARPPIYRDGDRYSLDPHDDEADLWAFRLGLRPARAITLHVMRPDSGPPRTRDQRLTVPELDEAAMRPDPAAIEANRRRIEREREAHGDELARMRRVLIHAFPRRAAEAVALVDVAERTVTTLLGHEIAQTGHAAPASSGRSAFERTFSTTLNYGSVRVLAEPIGTRRMDNITILDLRVEKGFRVAGGRRVAAFVDVLNLSNANPEQNTSWSSGSSFLQPLDIVAPRIARVGAKLGW